MLPGPCGVLASTTLDLPNRPVAASQCGTDAILRVGGVGHWRVNQLPQLKFILFQG